MVDKKKTLQLIIKCFTKFQKEQIEGFYQEDPTFREICQDYAVCIQMREKYSRDTKDCYAPQYKREYEGLIEALEKEMLAILYGHKNLP